MGLLLYVKCQYILCLSILYISCYRFCLRWTFRRVFLVGIGSHLGSNKIFFRFLLFLRKLPVSLIEYVPKTNLGILPTQQDPLFSFPVTGRECSGLKTSSMPFQDCELSESSCAVGASDTVPACGDEDSSVAPYLQASLARVLCVARFDGLSCNGYGMVSESCVCGGGVK